MRFDRGISMAVVAPLKRLGLWPDSVGVPILMYHSVSEDPEPGVSPYYRLAISPALFRRHMETLRDGGYRVVSLAKAVSVLGTDPQSARKMAVITFDDGFRDFSLQAWPILKEFGFAASVFLPTKFISDARQTFLNRECLTWEEVRELKRAGVDFGSHTVSHPKLVSLSEEELQRELVDSRDAIEQALSSSVETFAHPYAFPQGDLAYVERFRRCARAAGYRAAVTTIVGRFRPKDDLMTLRRLPANGADSPEFLAAKLSGAYDWIGVPQFFLKRIKGVKLGNLPGRNTVVA
jgi:peptidoglycan/xylan/chitin deacetylase (PgdA/CDA1 family)